MKLGENIIKGFLSQFKEDKVKHITSLIRKGETHFEISMNDEFKWIDDNVKDGKTIYWHWLLQRICTSVNYNLLTYVRKKHLVCFYKGKSIFVTIAK